MLHAARQAGVAVPTHSQIYQVMLPRRPQQREAARLAQAALFGTDVESDSEVFPDSDLEDNVEHIADVHDDSSSSGNGANNDEPAPVPRRRPGSGRGRGRGRGSHIATSQQQAVRGRGRGLPTQETEAANPYKDKNGRLWSPEPPQQRGPRDAANIVQAGGGRPLPSAVKNSILETWSLFFPDSMLAQIVAFSQMKADSLGIDVQLTVVQLKAYFGILYFRGVFGDQKIPIEQLWSDDYSIFYRTSMSRNLFQIWNRVLRFDNPVSREERKKTDTFAAMRDIWSEWNERLRTFYKASHSITIDEQLVASRCRSPHRIYNPSKPGKYGELVRWCTDATTRYFLNGSPLTKRPEDVVAAEAHKQSNRAKSLVIDLCGPFFNEGRNVTGDRFFSSMDVTTELLEKNTTYLGTLKKSTRDIPAVLHEPREQFESSFAFGGDRKRVTVQSYQVKSNRKVYLISSMHHSGETLSDGKKKSNMQLYYNETKSGVDVVDEMCKAYTVRTRVHRWPVVHMHNMLDVTGVNAYTIFNVSHPNWTSMTENRRRRRFLQQLATELSHEHMVIRLHEPVGLTSDLMRLICKATGESNPRGPTQLQEGQEAPQLRCVRCKESGKPTRDCNKTRQRCKKCGDPACGRHALVIEVVCSNCV